MKIYTKKGDQGQTSLLGGQQVSKGHVRIDAYGNTDELNSWIGLLKDECGDAEIQEWLSDIQRELFTIGSHLAVSSEAKNIKIPALDPDFVGQLESRVDQMESQLPELKNFLLPGGHKLVSYCHIARCVCRRAERAVVELSESEAVEEGILIALNRLSDFLFVLSRKLALITGATEIPWMPRK